MEEVTKMKHGWLNRLLKADARQQRMLEAFYKEYGTFTWSDMGAKLIGGFFIFISMIFQIIPWQEWEFPGDRYMIYMAMYLELMAIYLLMSRYTTYSEEGRYKMFSELFCYIPISRRQISVFRQRRVILLCFKLMVVVLACQVCFALTFYHTLSVWNVLFPIVGTFLLPAVLFSVSW